MLNVDVCYVKARGGGRESLLLLILKKFGHAIAVSVFRVDAYNPENFF